jgi:hypothetical protein
MVLSSLMIKQKPNIVPIQGQKYIAFAQILKANYQLVMLIYYEKKV